MGKLCTFRILGRLFRIKNTVCRDMQAMYQPIDSRESWDTPFVFDSNKVTAADTGSFCQCFLCHATIQSGIFDCQSKMYMFIFHYLFTSQ